MVSHGLVLRLEAKLYERLLSVYECEVSLLGMCDDFYTERKVERTPLCDVIEAVSQHYS